MLKIGTAGRPLSTKGKTTPDGISRVRELGLTCMEMEWVRRAPNPDSKTLTKSKEISKLKPEITLSCHASYYINLAGDPEIVSASKERIILATKSLVVAGGRNVVFHPGFYKGEPADKIHEIIRDNLLDIVSRLDKEGVTGYCLRPETTGKPTQYGSLEETVRLSKECPSTLPCIDFSHLHARSAGKFNTTEEFLKVLKLIRDELGEATISDMHIHLSGIEYTAKGERKHLMLENSDMNYKDLLKAFKKYDVSGTLICESPAIEDDALLIQKYYNSL